MPSKFPGEMKEEQEWTPVAVKIVRSDMPSIPHPGTMEKVMRVSVVPDLVAVLVMVPKTRAKARDLRDPRAKARDLRDPKAVNQALRTGAQVQTLKKFEAGTNKKAVLTAVDPRKLNEAEEPAALDRVSTEARQAIQKGRIEKKMSQAELAKQINERPQVVREYENGKAMPNQAILAKMEKVLGVKLRGLKHK